MTAPYRLKSAFLTLFLCVFLIAWGSLIGDSATAAVQDSQSTSTEVASSETSPAAGPVEGAENIIQEATEKGAEKTGPGALFHIVSYLIPLLGIIGLVFTYWKSTWVSAQEVGTDKMAGIAKYISQGAMSFLKAEYSVLIFFVAAVAVLLGWAGSKQDNSSAYVALSFVLGAFCSALAGFIGMRVATKANVRTTHAARTGLGQALEVAFAGGSVMGMGVVGLGVLGLSGLFLVYSNMFGLGTENDILQVITVLTGFSFGASSIALFARVGGGIYTCLLYTSPSPRDRG